MKALKEGAAYFVLVFSVGFVLGTIRTVWLVPRVGTRIAELLETPIMLVVTFLAARWVVRRFRVPPAPLRRLGVGLAALMLMLAAEFGLVLLRLRGLTLSEYWAGRDRVAEVVFRLSLALLAVMPVIVARGPRKEPLAIESAQKH